MTADEDGKCGAAEGWEKCALDTNECDREQIYSIVEYQGSFVREITNSKSFYKNGNGAFIYECFR